MAFKVGDILLKKYRLDAFLGLGGFSEVWKCYDLEAGQDQAVKIFLKQDEQGIALCREEYAKMSKLRHPHIMRPAFFTAQDGIPYFFMPYCDCGTALGQVSQLDEQGIANFIYQIGSALEYIHNRPHPILHNDLKPDNFLVEESGDYLLTDFGISDQLSQKLIEEQDEERRTRVLAEDERKGVTPKAYRAPELFKQKNAPKQPPVKASDIWAFAASIYQLITGETPFDKDGGDQQRIYYEINPQIQIDDIVRALPPGFSPALEQLLKRCLAFQPWDRPSAQDLVKAATLFLEKGVWQTQPIDPPAFYISRPVVHFGKVALQESAVQQLHFTTANMTGPLYIKTTAPFTLSLDEQNLASQFQIELQPVQEQRQLYVHFSPVDANREQGVISFTWKELRLHTLEVSGQGQEQRRVPGWIWLGSAAAAALALIIYLIISNQSPPVPAKQPEPVVKDTVFIDKPVPPARVRTPPVRDSVRRVTRSSEGSSKPEENPALIPATQPKVPSSEVPVKPTNKFNEKKVKILRDRH